MEPHPAGHYPARLPPDLPQSTITDAWVGDTLAAAITQITGGRPAILIGHSTGGYGALAVAWRAPHLVKAVVSIAGFARGVWTGTLGLLQRHQHLGRVGDALFDAQIALLRATPPLFDYIWQSCARDKRGFRASAYVRYTTTEYTRQPPAD